MSRLVRLHRPVSVGIIEIAEYIERDDADMNYPLKRADRRYAGHATLPGEY